MRGGLFLRNYKAAKSPWILLVLLIIGGLVGSLLGEAFGTMLPILKQTFVPIGFSPTTVNLVVVTITFGIMIKLNVASIVGFLLALIIFFRI